MPKIYDIHSNLPANRGRKIDTRMKLVPGYGYVPATREIDQVKAHNVAVEKAIQAKNYELSAEPALEKSASVRRFETPQTKLVHSYVMFPRYFRPIYNFTRQVPIESNHRDVFTNIYTDPDKTNIDSIANVAFNDVNNILSNLNEESKHINNKDKSETYFYKKDTDGFGKRIRRKSKIANDEYSYFLDDYLKKFPQYRNYIKNAKEYKKFSNGGQVRRFYNFY